MSQDDDRITMYSEYVYPFCYLGRRSGTRGLLFEDSVSTAGLSIQVPQLTNTRHEQSKIVLPFREGRISRPWMTPGYGHDTIERRPRMGVL